MNKDRTKSWTRPRTGCAKQALGSRLPGKMARARNRIEMTTDTPCPLDFGHFLRNDFPIKSISLKNDLGYLWKIWKWHYEKEKMFYVFAMTDRSRILLFWSFSWFSCFSMLYWCFSKQIARKVQIFYLLS